MKQQIEDMYEQSDNTTVTIVAHSMGAPTTLFFLNPENGIVTSEWKSMYLHALVTLSGGWAGSLLTLREQVSGGTIGGIKIPSIIKPGVEKYLRDITRTLETGFWMLPNPAVPLFNNT